MITHHTPTILGVYVARVLVEQMLDFILMIEHQHQCDDGKLSTSASGKVAYSALAVGFDGGDELFHIAAHDGLFRFTVHLASILVGWVMGEVAADDKQIVVVEISAQHLCHPFEFGVIVGGDDDGYDGRNLLHTPLKER